MSRSNGSNRAARAAATTTSSLPPPNAAKPGDPASAAALAASIRAGQDRFVSIWGEMGSSWGIPRTMAEVHALLYITGEAMCTDDLMQRLQISRGNASMSLRALTDWAIVSRVHKRGDRKEYFRAEQDVWQMFRTILRERKRREIDPVLAALYECRDLTAGRSRGNPLQQHAGGDADRQPVLGDSADASPDTVEQAPFPSARTGEDEPPTRGGSSRSMIDFASQDAASPDRAELLRALNTHNERLDAMLEFMQLVDKLAERFVNRDGNGLRMAAGLLGKVI